jgi:predicted Zn-dependent protease with MMP-like domain
MTDHEEADLHVVEAIYDALDEGDAERAYQLAQTAIAADSDDDPVVLFLAGMALVEMDQPERAVDSLLRATELDPEDAEFRSHLAFALYHCCRFDEGLAEARRALEQDPSLPDAHRVAALLLERGEARGEAEEHFERAARLDPERFPAPLRFSDAEFRAEIEKAGSMLPEEIARHLDEVAITVEPLPSDEILREEDPPLDPELFGLFVGVPLTEKSFLSPGGELPPRILLFQRNLERSFPVEEELVREIAVTLRHELGHYLGFDEEDLDDMGLA